jgi:hypothetical protein
MSRIGVARGSARGVVTTVPRMDSNHADLDSVRDYAADLPAAWLQCRELGHNWGRHSARGADDGGFDRVLRCRRCPTRRHQVLDAYGRIVSNAYE